MAEDNGPAQSNARAYQARDVAEPPGKPADLFVALPLELLQLVADGKLSVKAAWVYVLLLSCINHRRGDSKVWPSRRWIAERMRMTQVRAVDRYIDELEAVGLLDRDRRRDGKVNDTNMYTLRLVRTGGSAQQSTTLRPAETQVSAGQGVVHKQALGSAQQSTRGSAQTSTGVVHSCAPELDEVELDEVKQDQLTTSSPYPLNDPHPTLNTSTQEEEGIESKNNDLKTLATNIALSYRGSITVVEARRLANHLHKALTQGWDEQAIHAELDADWTGLASIGAGLIARARTLGTPPEPESDPEDLHPYVPNPDDPGFCAYCTLHKDSTDHTPPPTGWGAQTTGTQTDPMLTGFMAEPSSCPDHPDQSGVNCPECAEERRNRRRPNVDSPSNIDTWRRQSTANDRVGAAIELARKYAAIDGDTVDQLWAS